MPPIPRPDPCKISKMAAITLPDAALNGTPSTKTLILCSNARKQGFQTPKAHKNLDFVLEMPENGGSEGQKSTKTSILCSKTLKTGVPKAKKAQKHRFCARGDWDWLREAQPLPSCKSPRTLQKRKYLITK